MFKKAVEAKAQQRLSGADRKKLRRALREKFPRGSDADFDTLLPPKAELALTKFQNRVHLYSLEGSIPVFFDIDGRGTDVFPTVYALWKVPELLPAFFLKGGEVSRYVIGGADLMFPGISVPPEGLPPFLAGETWAVKVPGNPAPIAVGTTTMSSTEALKAGLRGKALRITHYYRDLLWESAAGGHCVPNEGFFEDIVCEDPAYLSSTQSSDACENVSDASNDQKNIGSNKEVGGSIDGGDVQSIANATSAATETDVDNDISKQITANVGDLKVADNISVDESNMEDKHVLSTEDIDMLLDKCFLQALHTTVKDKDLPMPGSTLWANHVLPCRPSGVTLDIKKSSFKKLSKWLQAKSTAGLIQVKEDKHKKETMLCAVNRNHPEYSSFRPEKRPVERTELTSEHGAKESQSPKMLEVVEIYKPSTHVNPIFASVGIDSGKLYSPAEATDVVFKYIEKENLVKPANKSIVVLDAILCDALFKGSIKKGTMYPTEVHKKDIGSTFVNRMQAHHLVIRGSESVVRKGALKTIQILTERRQGNKKVTKLTGFETFLIDADVLASELQKKCAASTSVTEVPGKKGHEVLVQGGVIEDVARYLVEHYGIPKKYIEVLDKTRR